MKTFAMRCAAALCGALLGGAVRMDSQSVQKAGYLLSDGTVRIVGTPDVNGVIARLNTLYTQRHPETKFRYEEANSTAAIFALMFDASAFAPITSYFGGSATYSDVAHGPAFSVRIAHASLKAGTRLSPYVVITHSSNPLGRISVGELTQVFTQPMRQRVISTWAQAGVKDGFGETAIVPCGLPWSDHYSSEDTSFADEIFTRKLGGAPPVESYRGFSTYADVGRFVASTRGAIGIVPANQAPADVKVMGVVETIFGEPQTATDAQIRAGHYPLDRFVYINAHAVSGKPLDPMVLAYLQLALSPEGQAAIAADAAGYIPLSETERQEELAKFQ